VSQRSWAVIDLDALRHNLGKVRQYAPGTRVMAAVKANGYGHGAIRVAQALSGADALAVATLEEGQQLRQAGIQQAIVLLGGVLDKDMLVTAVEHGLTMVVHDFHQLALIEAEPRAQAAAVWLKLDTGMHRLGFAPEAVNELARRLRQLPRLRVQGWMTHFASADDCASPATQTQIQVFQTALAGIDGARSLANSAAIIAWPAAHADWVRPGIMLYGASPFPDRSAAALGLKPVMSLHSRILSVRELAAGEAIGYGGTWITPEPMRIAVLAIGYGDGYPRHIPNGTPVLVNGHPASVVGRVSMDLLTVDLRGCETAQVGDIATLWGAGLPAEEIAAAAGTIAYELFCDLSARVAVEYRTQD
jgi:alanine racemase